MKIKNVTKWIFFLPASQIAFSLINTISFYGVALAWGIIYGQNPAIIFLLVPTLLGIIGPLFFYLNLFSAFIAGLVSPSKITYFLSFGLLAFLRLKTIITYSPMTTTTDDTRIVDMPTPIVVAVYLAQLVIILIYGLFKYQNDSGSESKMSVSATFENDLTEDISVNDEDVVVNTPQPFNPKDKQKKDFGIYMKGVATNPNTSIHIVDPFTIINLVLYPDGSSSITGVIDNMLVTFDFDDSILKVFIYALSKLGLITKTDLNQRLKEQSDEPIVYDFSRNGVLVTGVVLECKLGETAKSETTNEAFIPLTIKIAKIVQEPAAILIDTNNHG